MGNLKKKQCMQRNLAIILGKKNWARKSKKKLQKQEFSLADYKTYLQAVIVSKESVPKKVKGIQNYAIFVFNMNLYLT